MSQWRRSSRAPGGGKGRLLLISGGAASAALAVLHVVVIVVGAPAYRFFGAGETLAGMAEAGSLVPAAVTFLIALAFVVLAVYGFAGAGIVPRPPLLRAMLVAIAGVYLLRGLSALPQAVALVVAPGSFPVRYFVFSLAALGIGICHALGTARAWMDLRGRRT